MFVAKTLTRQGRFTSPDPLLSSADISDPQSWNRYSYSLNNPVRYVDPTGLWIWDVSAGGPVSDAELDRRMRDTSSGWFRSWRARREAKRALRFRDRFRAARKEAEKAASSSRITPEQRQQVRESVEAYGSENDNNGVIVGVRPNSSRSDAATELMNDHTIKVLFNRSLDGLKMAEKVAHEGRHVADAQAWVANGECTSCSLNMNKHERDTRAWNVSSYTGQALNMRSAGAGSTETQVWNRGWKQADISTKRARGLAAIMKLYGYTPNGTDTLSWEHHRQP